MLNEDEFKKACDSLKSHKVCRFHELHVNAIKSVYEQTKTLLLHVFNNYIEFSIFSEKTKLGYSDI